MTLFVKARFASLRRAFASLSRLIKRIQEPFVAIQLEELDVSRSAAAAVVAVPDAEEAPHGAADRLADGFAHARLGVFADVRVGR